jgi:hypothetical protein
MKILEESRMKSRWIGPPLGFLPACGATFPTPTQRMADAESAHRSAPELGAAKNIVAFGLLVAFSGYATAPLPESARV